eukprot:COSAG02_NODE_3773_length_6254_cov_1.873599_3_plen_170_part_00
MVGRGMLAQLFMLEVLEPSQEFTLSEGLGQVSKKVESEEMKAYADQLSSAQSLEGTADFTRLVMLMRQSTTAGCFTDELMQMTYTCSACWHARNPRYERRNVAGHNWDGGRTVVVPRDRNGNDGDRVRVYLVCKRSGIRRFHGFHERSDHRNNRAIIDGDGLGVWYRCT